MASLSKETVWVGEAAAIVEAAGENPDSGVLKTLDVVYRMTRIRERCLSWGDAPTRLANLDALMAHAVNYIDPSSPEGVGCTPAGLIAHLKRNGRQWRRHPCPPGGR